MVSPFASMMRTPTTSVLAGMYSVKYPCRPRTILSGTGKYLNRNRTTSPGATLTSVVPPPLEVPDSGSIRATVAGRQRFIGQHLGDAVGLGTPGGQQDQRQPQQSPTSAPSP